MNHPSSSSSCNFVSLCTPMFNCSSSSNFTSPILLRVLLVDDDFTHLCMVEQILHSFGHQVAKLHSPEAALVALQTNNYMFDIVVSGASMSAFGGLKLVRFAGLELDIPVVLMTLNSSHEVAIRGIVNGASKCLAKPIQPENLKNIWQIVLSKQRDRFAQSFCSTQIQAAPVSINSGGPSSEIIRSPAAAAACGGGPSCSNPKSNLKKREGATTSKKPRLIWTDEPHQIFLDAVKKLECGRVVPTRILDYMRKNGCSNITRENIASHLQKHRLYVKKLENEIYRSSKLSSQSCVNVTNGENLSFPPNQTLSIKNNTPSSCSTTPNLPLDETLALDQNMEIGWDILLHEGMPTTDFQNMYEASKISQENDIPATGHPLPQQIVPLGEEKNMFSMDNLCPPILSNQMYNVHGNIPIKSDSQDLRNEERFCLEILEDYERMYLNDYGNGSL